MKYNVIALGECLIDFVPNGGRNFEANPGGAPANVLSMYAKLGGNTAFVGKVGDDSFGEMLVDNMNQSGIDTSYVVSDKKFNTTLAFVHLDEKGDRSFSFYRKNSADVMLSYDEIPIETLKNAEIFHFGSVSLTDSPSREAIYFAAKTAKENGIIISYDPNYRPLLWDSAEEAKKEMKKGASFADIIKVSDEELTLLTDEPDIKKGAMKLIELGISIVLVTMGEKGSFYMTDDFYGYVNTLSVNTIDTTGAGDAFLGAFLWKLRNVQNIKCLSKTEVEEAVSFSNIAGALTTTKKGAIPAMPMLEEINSIR